MPESFRAKQEKLAIILENSPTIDRSFSIPPEEFVERRRRTWEAVKAASDIDVAVAFSDEHYSGDGPYLGGNTNVSIEQVAFGLGPNPLTSGIIAGFEGVYITGQLAPRARCAVYVTPTLQLADEQYPVEGATLKEILEKIAGKEVKTIGLLTPRNVIPDGIVKNLESVVGRGFVVDAQLPFQKIKNEKSFNEMRAIQDAAYVSAIALRAMLAVLEPGMLETEVAAFGDMIAKYMGCEKLGFQTMVGSDSACVTMIGHALNRPILLPKGQAGYLHLGTSFKRDGLTACSRRSVFITADGSPITPYHLYWRDLVESAFRVGFDAYIDVARNNKPARLQEQALVDFFNEHTEEMIQTVGERYGESAAGILHEALYRAMQQLAQGGARLKPYTGTHNSGYTECQEFYGAITLDSNNPLAQQIVTMLDVALRGRSSRWLGTEFESVIPEFDYWVVEDTLGKCGPFVSNFTGELQADGLICACPGRLPINVQHLVGNVNEYMN